MSVNSPLYAPGLAVVRVMNLHWSHLDPDYVDLLDEQAIACGDASSADRRLTVCGAPDIGWHIRVDDPFAAVYVVDAPQESGTLPTLMSLALDHDCAWLFLSPDGPTVAGLITFEPEEERTNDFYELENVLSQMAKVEKP